MPKMPPSEKRSTANRNNGRRGGRPRKGGFEAEMHRMRDRARELCRRHTVAAAELWVDILKGRVPGVSVEHMLRASENLADRGLLPRLQQQELVGEEIPIKLYDLRGWTGPEAVKPEVEQGVVSSNPDVTTPRFIMEVERDDGTQH